MDLMQFTANQLKSVILKEAPQIKGYKKKKKELLIKIINDNQLNVSSLEVLMKPIENVKPVSTLVTFD